MENLTTRYKASHDSIDRCQLVGTSSATLQVVNLARRVANSAAPALLVGPSGTEFEIIAEFIHQHSPQAASALVRQRCISWQDLSDPLGMVGTGTLFVEGIEHASLPVQLRLLHELEQAQLLRLTTDGTAIQTPRIIASTCVDLIELVTNGLFIEDLYWHLSSLVIKIPPLSQRSADIAEIAPMLLTKIFAIHRPAIQPTLTPKAIQQLQAYHWPGNYRELYSILQRAALLANRSELSFDFSPKHTEGLPDTERNPSTRVASSSALPVMNFADLVQEVVKQGIIEADRSHRELYQFVVDHIESALISAILKECENVQTKTASRLGINRNTLHKKMKDFGLESAD